VSQTDVSSVSIELEPVARERQRGGGRRKEVRAVEAGSRCRFVAANEGPSQRPHLPGWLEPGRFEALRDDDGLRLARRPRSPDQWHAAALPGDPSAGRVA